MVGLLLSFVALTNCASVGKNPETVEEAQKLLERQKKQQARIHRKDKKRAEKYYWSLQTKEANRSIRRNRRRQ